MGSTAAVLNVSIAPMTLGDAASHGMLPGTGDLIVTPNSASPVDAKRVTLTTAAETQTSESATAFCPAAEPFVRLPERRLAPAPYTFDMRGQWEGTVTDVSSQEFGVVLRDLVNPDAKEYEAVFSIDEVADDDRDLLKPGAILYWTIGYQQRRGQRLRVSEVRLRRLPAWSRADLARVEKAASDLGDLFEP